jgi:acyl-coenzyme A thioesterase PaaI-like protein
LKVPYERIKHEFTERVPFFATVGLTLEHVGQGTARARLENRKDISNHLGTCHAGALFSLGEGTSGAAVIGVFAEIADDVRAVSTHCTIAYQNIARGSILCDAKVRESVESLRAQLDDTGQAECHVDVDVVTSGGKEVATMAATWLVLKRRAKSA